MDENVKTEIVRFRATKEQKEEIEKRAKRYGLKVSQYLTFYIFSPEMLGLDIKEKLFL